MYILNFQDCRYKTYHSLYLITFALYSIRQSPYFYQFRVLNHKRMKKQLLFELISLYECTYLAWKRLNTFTYLWTRISLCSCQNTSRMQGKNKPLNINRFLLEKCALKSAFETHLKPKIACISWTLLSLFFCVWCESPMKWTISQRRLIAWHFYTGWGWLKQQAHTTVTYNFTTNTLTQFSSMLRQITYCVDVLWSLKYL